MMSMVNRRTSTGSCVVIACAVCLTTLLGYTLHGSNKTYEKYQHYEQEEQDFVIQSSYLSSDEAFDPTVANGYLGYRIYSDTIYVNGLYNGAGGDTHRARIPGTLPYADTEKAVVRELYSDIEEKSSRNYTTNITLKLDMKNGVFTQRSEISREFEGPICHVTQKWYAHRLVSHLLVTEIFVDLLVSGGVVIPLQSSSGARSEDIDFQSTANTYEETMATPSLDSFSSTCGSTIKSEQPDSDVQYICVVTGKFGKNISVSSEKMGENTFKYTFITSIAEKKNDASRLYQLGTQMDLDKTLFSSHSDEWQRLWKYGSLTVKHDVLQSQMIISGLYSLLSVFPSIGTSQDYFFNGVSPGGLTKGRLNDSYLGHIFWDQEFWMLPALLPLFPELVKKGLEYRVSKLGAARMNAMQHGFKGAMYPWESAYTGLDVCPGEAYRKYEIHITGDIIHILKQYMYLTGDWQFLSEVVVSENPSKEEFTPWDMLYDSAVYWLSRVSWNETHSGYDINGVMGPDEYNYPVNNSAFTNVIALQSLQFAVEVSKKLKKELPAKIEQVLKYLIVPFEEEKNFHPEFDGFNPDHDKVKQADTIMLGFPLLYDKMTMKSHANDLLIYERLTDPHGPAMTWSMFAVNWLAIQDFNKANKAFMQQQNNIQGPFYIWSEEPQGYGAVNFLTGVGGYLQSILYGYVGLRIRKDGITFTPTFPPGTNVKKSRLFLYGLKFQNSILNFEMGRFSYILQLVKFTSKRFTKVIVRSGGETSVMTQPGDTVRFKISQSCSVRIDSS